MALKTERHKWVFKARFRRRAFGWRSQPAIQRVKEAVSEIKKVRRQGPILAAEGAVAFLERISPALEQVDSSSGAIGTTVNRAIDQLVPIIAGAAVDEKTRRGWLERLFEALQADQIPYIERLGDSWGRPLCHQGDRLRPGRSADQHHPKSARAGPNGRRVLFRHLGLPECPLQGGTLRGAGRDRR